MYDTRSRASPRSSNLTEYILKVLAAGVHFKCPLVEHVDCDVPDSLGRRRQESTMRY